MNLPELKATIEAEALRRQAARDGFTLDAVKSYLGQGLEVPPELRVTPPPPGERLHYRYFAGLHGRHLVTSCYSILLGRGPDPGGMEHYVDLLTRGANKALIVGSFAYSPEGRKRNARVAGLLPRFAIAAAKKVPVAGAVLEWVLALATLHVGRREARASEQQVHARLDAIAQYVGHSSAQVAMRIDSLRSVMESRD